MAETPAQKKVSKKWRDKNKEHRAYLTYRSIKRSSIKNKATAEDIEKIKKLIRESNIQD